MPKVASGGQFADIVAMVLGRQVRIRTERPSPDIRLAVGRYALAHPSLPRPSRPGIVLDGPVLGVLPAEAKQAIQDISLRSQDLMQAYLDAQRSAGKEANPVEMAKLRQQTRDSLAHLLSPPELE